MSFRRFAKNKLKEDPEYFSKLMINQNTFPHTSIAKVISDINERTTSYTSNITNNYQFIRDNIPLLFSEINGKITRKESLLDLKTFFDSIYYSVNWTKEEFKILRELGRTNSDYKDLELFEKSINALAKRFNLSRNEDSDQIDFESLNKKLTIDIDKIEQKAKDIMKKMPSSSPLIEELSKQLNFIKNTIEELNKSARRYQENYQETMDRERQLEINRKLNPSLYTETEKTTSTKKGLQY